MSDADRIIGHYERHAATWDEDRARAAWNDKPWHDRFIAMLPKSASVLDLGCGSGNPVARNMAAQGLKITGVDSSPTFISLCRDRLPGHTWIVGDMRALSLKPSFQEFWRGTAFSISSLPTSARCSKCFGNTPPRSPC